jgi:hypothetical protein
MTMIQETKVEVGGPITRKLAPRIHRGAY